MTMIVLQNSSPVNSSEILGDWRSSVWLHWFSFYERGKIRRGILRNNGTMKGIISLESESLDEVKEKIEGFSNKEAVKSVSTKNSYTIEGSGKHVAIIDLV